MLKSTPGGSPYLLPEWTAFWENAWTRTRGEFWTAPISPGRTVAVVALRRRRLSFDWVFAQPFGTPGGWIGSSLADSESRHATDTLLQHLVNRGTLQVALTLPQPPEAQDGWICAVDPSHAWILDCRQSDPSDPIERMTESHRRNVEKGRKLNGTIGRIRTARDAGQLLTDWSGPLAHPSRIVRHRKHAPLITEAFQNSEAMHWWVLRVGDRPVATTLWLVLGDRAVFVDGASERDPEITGANHYLFGMALREMFEAGVRVFDLGAGPLGQSSEGLDRFKEGWGARKVPRTEFVMRRPWYHRLRHFV